MVDWLEPWHPVTEADVVLEQELQRELAPHHNLFGVPLRLAARRFDCDDALFELRDGSGRVAVVHLTLKGSAELPGWPRTRIYRDSAAWVEYGMPPEQEMYEDTWPDGIIEWSNEPKAIR